MSVPEVVVNHVREYRRSKPSMTQQDLADAVGVTRQTIIAIEKGKYDPSVGLALKLAQVFEIPLEALFELDSE